MRYICNKGYRSHTNDLYLENKILKINELYLYQLGTLMFQRDRQELPNNFVQLFTKNYQVDGYAARQSRMLYLPQVRTNSAKKTLVFVRPKFWNSLDLNLKSTPGFYLFKPKLKLVLLNKLVCACTCKKKKKSVNFDVISNKEEQEL